MLDTYFFYAAGAVVLALVLIPVGTMFAFLPYSIVGGVGKALLGRGGTDDEESARLLHVQAKPDATGFYDEEDLNRPFDSRVA
jgi:hypothetical protein